MDLTCPFCQKQFNTQNHQPFQLGCGHCICKPCLEDKKQQGDSLNCVKCPKVTEGISELRENFPLKSALDDVEILCTLHRSEVASHFCFDHVVAMCQTCLEKHSKSHPYDHKVLSADQTNELGYTLQEFLKSLMNTDRLPQSQKEKMTAAIRQSNKKKVAILEEVFNQVKCYQCGSTNVRWMNVQGGYFTCEEESHRTIETDDGSGNCSWVEINEPGREGLESLLMRKGKEMLRLVCSYFLTQDLLNIYRNRLEDSEINQLLELLQELHRLLWKSSQPVPDWAICLQCGQMFALQYFYQFPCRGTSHSLCRYCVQQQLDSSQYLTCPIDGNQFSGADFSEYLTRLVATEPVAVQGPVREDLKQNEVNTDDGSSVAQSQGSCPVSFTSLPPYSGALKFVDKFPNVVPKMGTDPQLYGSNFKPWYIDPRKNTVEAVTFLSVNKVSLVGFAMSCPTISGVVVSIDFIKLYFGQDAVGEPMYAEVSSGHLIGGNSVCQDVILKRPFEVQAYQKYSVKMKLSCPGTDSKFHLYRGNPFNRPDLCFGSDGAFWEFSECAVFDQGEIGNGQCNLSGPYLRFYYN